MAACTALAFVPLGVILVPVAVGHSMNRSYIFVGFPDQMPDTQLPPAFSGVSETCGTGQSSGGQGKLECVQLECVQRMLPRNSTWVSSAGSCCEVARAGRQLLLQVVLLRLMLDCPSAGKSQPSAGKRSTRSYTA